MPRPLSGLVYNFPCLGSRSPRMYKSNYFEGNKKPSRGAVRVYILSDGFREFIFGSSAKKNPRKYFDYTFFLLLCNLLSLFFFSMYFVIMFSESPVTSAIWIRSIFALYILYASSSLFGVIFILWLDLLANIEYQQASSPLKRLWVEDHRIWQNPLPL